MKFAKWSFLVLMVAMLACLAVHATADDASKTVTGKASCGHCSGVVSSGCCVLLTDNDGGRWVLKGNSEILKPAMAERMSGKTMTATIVGKPVTKKGKDGQDYKEVKVSDVKIAA